MVVGGSPVIFPRSHSLRGNAVSVRCAAQGLSERFGCGCSIAGLLVPKLQLGNSVWEAPASRLAKLVLRHLGSQAGAWEPA